jgi:hypothetical protein
MPDQVRVLVSQHHSPEEDTFTAQLVARVQVHEGGVDQHLGCVQQEVTFLFSERFLVCVTEFPGRPLSSREAIRTTRAEASMAPGALG